MLTGNIPQSACFLTRSACKNTQLETDIPQSACFLKQLVCKNTHPCLYPP